MRNKTYLVSYLIFHSYLVLNIHMCRKISVSRKCASVFLNKCSLLIFVIELTASHENSPLVEPFCSTDLAVRMKLSRRRFPYLSGKSVIGVQKNPLKRESLSAAKPRQ